MNTHRLAAVRLARFVVLSAGLLASLSLVLAPRAATAADVDYQRTIKPLLAKRCYACHAAVQQKHGLRVDTAALAAKGGEAGPAIVPGRPDASLLLQAITGEAGFQMPPAGEGTPLTPEEIKLVRDWIAQGAKGFADEKPEPDPREFWSYRPAVRAPLPTVARRDWPLDPVDVLIAAEHEARQLAPRPAASRETWLRRTWLDLLGVLPPRETVDEFLADEAPDADVRQVERLLASPLHGQRWGRHWMDVWRYSDWYGSRGINEIRYSQRHIWRWRDWIVDAANADKSYDRMIVEMLAGDELAPTDPDVLRATGFIGRNWYKFDRNVWMFDAVEHTAQAFLATTIRCCRCHDHKYDPLSQEDYYRFRAFFEPHDVRTDVLAAGVAQEKDATLGMVPADGVARVFDKQLDVPTYVFQRGDNRYPDESRKMAPGVPASLGGATVSIAAVPLPADAFYPALRPAFAADSVRKSQAASDAAEVAIQKARNVAQAAEALVAAREKLVAAGTATDESAPPPSFRDDFARARPDVWTAAGGQWTYENGRLVQKSVQSFATYVAKQTHPRDFKAKYRYRALQPGTLRSIGFSFDYVDQGNSQDVYTSSGDAAQSVQAFHRLNGQQVYPQAGIVKTALKAGDETTVEIEVRGQQLVIWLNGEKKLDYVCPTPRRDGAFALWVHDGSAEFLELEIRPLVATLADLRRAWRQSVDAIGLAEKKKSTALAETASLEARLAAERAKYDGAPADVAQPLALAAGRAERNVAVCKADEAVLQAEQQVTRIRESLGEPLPMPLPAVLVEADKKLVEAQAARSAAVTARDAPDAKYAPLGELFPTTSTGRRLALARWIAQRDNPRTARVAVNHVWLRHFGQALVPSVANFGLNGDRPTNQKLLDALTVDFTDSDWSFKTLHRRLVLSRTYAMSSASGAESESNAARDRDNQYLWRMNSRRMEAEAVRDAVLFSAGMLDARLGGAEVPESQGHDNPRRSLYFRLTPNEKMKFLELFDAADPNGCYRRRESVVPQQALALLNSPLAFDAARTLATELTREAGPAGDAAATERFIRAAFAQLLGRAPGVAEHAACAKFLAEQTELARIPTGGTFPAAVPTRVAPSTDPAQRAREDLIHVLFSHNDFVTIR